MKGTNMAAELYGQSTTVSSDAVTVTLAAGAAPTTMLVVDSILFTGQSSGAGALTLEHNIGAAGAVIIARNSSQQLPHRNSTSSIGPAGFRSGLPAAQTLLRA